jgi:hypothetical protein
MLVQAQGKEEQIAWGFGGAQEYIVEKCIWQLKGSSTGSK